MNTRQLRLEFEGRKTEVTQYLDLLKMIEASAGPFGSVIVPGVTRNHVSILRAHMYLHLYNLIEATMNWCLQAAAAAPMRRKSWQPHHLIPQVWAEIVRNTMKNSSNEASVANRAISLTTRLMDKEPVQTYQFGIVKGAGNWKRDLIWQVSADLGVTLSLERETAKRIHQSGYIDTVCRQRNDLAHGHLSFEQSGGAISTQELEELTIWTLRYLSEILSSYIRFIDGHEFLQERHRPKGLRNAANQSS